jgi:hypothetical protein
MSPDARGRVHPEDVDTAAMPFAVRCREGADIGEQRRSAGGSGLRFGMPDAQYRRPAAARAAPAFSTMRLPMAAAPDALRISAPCRFETAQIPESVRVIVSLLGNRSNTCSRQIPTVRRSVGSPPNCTVFLSCRQCLFRGKGRRKARLSAMDQVADIGASRILLETQATEITSLFLCRRVAFLVQKICAERWLVGPNPAG